VKSGNGSILYLLLNLSDLRTIKVSAQEFLSKESRLGVFWHNAGVMIPDDGDIRQLKATTNYLELTHLHHFFSCISYTLMIMIAVLPLVPHNSARMIFVSSSGHRVSPMPDGVSWDDINLERSK